MVRISMFYNYFVIEPQGPLTKEDFAAIADRVDPLIANKGTLGGLIVRTREFPGWESLGDIIAHFRFVKIALVTDAKIAEVFPVIVDHFVKAEVKHFAFNDFDEAVEWVAEG